MSDQHPINIPKQRPIGTKTTVAHCRSIQYPIAVGVAMKKKTLIVSPANLEAKSAPPPPNASDSWAWELVPGLKWVFKV